MEDFVHSCRVSDYHVKTRSQPLCRINFAVEGHWPVGRTMAEEQELGGIESHPLELDVNLKCVH
eukprot:8982369-Pyramimonas_sp.AAC.1